MKIARFIFRLFDINTYVVWDPSTGKAAVIDPGMSSEDEEKALQAFIEREKLEVSILINTHLHIDHACGNGFVMREYGVKAAANINDKPLGESLKSQGKTVACCGMTEAVRSYFDRAGITELLGEESYFWSADQAILDLLDAEIVE